MAAIHHIPDVPPGSGDAPIVYVAYDYYTPAESPVMHRLVPGEVFRCHVPASGAKRFCVLIDLREV